MKVVLLEPLNVSDAYIERLAEPIREMGYDFVYYNQKTTDTAELVKRSEGADIVIIANNPYPTEVINQIPTLKLIDVAFTGVDHVGYKEADNQDILVCNAAGYANQAVAELCLGLSLALYRYINQGDQDLRLGEAYPGPIQGREIFGKTVGIIGTGNIGLMTAKLYQAFGAKLIAYSDPVSEAGEAMGIEYLSLDEVLSHSDIVSLHLPLTQETTGLINRERIALMKDTAIFINCARGPIVDNQALAEALNKGEIAGAGIDVFDTEPPLPLDDPLLNAKNTILTPHIAYLTDEAMISRAQIAFDNARAFIEGKPQNIVTF